MKWRKKWIWYVLLNTTTVLFELKFGCLTRSDFAFFAFVSIVSNLTSRCRSTALHPFHSLAGRTSSRLSALKSVHGSKAKIRHSLIDNGQSVYLHLTELSFPFSKCLYLNETLNCCSLALGNAGRTILVLEKRILFMERPALLIGCSYILLNFYVYY